MAYQLDIRYPDSLGPKRKLEYHKCILSVLRSISDNSNVPDGWLGFYAYKQLVLAACLFGTGKYEEGKAEFLSAVEKLRYFYQLTDEFLDMGGILFGNLKVNRFWDMAMDTQGKKHRLYGISTCFEPDCILHLLTNPHWAWFNSARNEDYYKDTIKWLEGLAKQNLCQ